jgi:hypothetical protein
LRVQVDGHPRVGEHLVEGRAFAVADAQAAADQVLALCKSSQHRNTPTINHLIRPRSHNTDCSSSIFEMLRLFKFALINF